ncbi:MAG TPA: VTT domain-containing protein [Myxococcota bacterium]|nr:VTT domain-containing protein [Myxococcota bacterium]
MVALGVTSKLFHAELVSFGEAFVGRFGGLGVAFGFFYPDMIPVPGVHEAFSAFGLLGGMPFWEVVAWAFAGSITGGTIGFFLGRSLRTTERLSRFLQEGRGRYVHGLVQRYGTWALALVAVSPIPYSIGCWSCGALDYPLWKFLAVSLLRIPRIAFYLWLIQMGFLVAT